MNVKQMLDEGKLPVNCHYNLTECKKWLLTQPVGRKAIQFVAQTGEVLRVITYKGKEGDLDIFEAQEVI